MTTIEYFDPQPAQAKIPISLQNPFDNCCHPLAVKAARRLQNKLDKSPSLSNGLLAEGGGKMFGVLVVADPSGKLGYLSSFSGMLNRRWMVPGFVPPVFNMEEQSAFLADGEARLKSLFFTIDSLRDNPERHKAMQQLAELTLKSEEELCAFKRGNQENRKERRLAREKMAADDFRLLLRLSLSSQQDKKAYKCLKAEWGEKLRQLRERLEREYDDKINQLRAEGSLMSQQLHNQVFDGYRLRNSLGEVARVRTLFEGKIPPGGTGDCAAPKLLQFAFKNRLKPLALAEFWYGASPLDGVRHHGEFYPPCRGKCQPILPFMLKGLGIETALSIETDTQLTPEIVFEDADIVVIDKPAGLLSIPGKIQKHSVSSWLAQRFPEATGPLLVHRLDMATSGLLLAAKNSRAHKILQKQFISRRVEKRYVAVLSKPPGLESKTIELPLRVDLDDRPRQLVCYEYGKKAVTRVEAISSDKQGTRVYFYPLTGRTHQLRVHAAHSLGLCAPIVGDELYGTRSNRLLLHANRLSFDHPTSGIRMTLEATTPF